MAMRAFTSQWVSRCHAKRQGAAKLHLWNLAIKRSCLVAGMIENAVRISPWCVLGPLRVLIRGMVAAVITAGHIGGIPDCSARHGWLEADAGALQQQQSRAVTEGKRPPLLAAAPRRKVTLKTGIRPSRYAVRSHGPSSYNIALLATEAAAVKRDNGFKSDYQQVPP